MNHQDSTSSSLIDRLRIDDQAAWARLVNLYAPLVYQWSRRVGLPEDDAADVGQEVFRTVSSKIKEFRREQRGSFRSWLWTITRHKIGDYLKQLQARDVAIGGTDSRIKNLATIEPPPDSEPANEQADQQALFAAALRLIQTDFQERTWQAFWRATIEEQPMDQIANDLGMETKAVRQAKYRVLKRLREEFGELLE